jgi:hypothetical protein
MLAGRALWADSACESYFAPPVYLVTVSAVMV